jgi:formylglycine-generating enzyme required for sulfatase activity
MTHKLFSSLMIVLIITACAPATSAPAPTTTPVPATSTATIISTPTLGIGSTLTSDKDGMTLVFVPAGEFTMGSDTGYKTRVSQDRLSGDERPEHQVVLDAFWIDQTEVTNAMYAKCWQDGACSQPGLTKSYTRDSYFGNSEFYNYPVIYVSWDDAKAYCAWADRRLPTEAEWEKAARGTDGRTYPWGNDVPNNNLLNYYRNVGDTTEVGKYQDGASPYGALDMAGNVGEWVNDWYDVYPGGDANISSDFGQTYRVVRGGAWYFDDDHVHSAYRSGDGPDLGSSYIGFRCAVSENEQAQSTSSVRSATSTSQPITTDIPAPTETSIPPTSEFGVVGSTLTSDKDGMTLVFVPAGEFTMGSDADDALAECQKFRSDCQRDWFTDEEPPHSVHVDDFWIDQTEVTNRMYALCVEAGVCQEPTSTGFDPRSRYYGNAEFDNYPVILADWSMAKTYCEWAGRRLPTEAEWEKAARGENASVYPWGDTFDGSLVNFCDTNCPANWANKSFNDGFADVAPVGSYPSGKSVYGALDMAGNVLEWVSSLYKPYPYDATDGRENLDSSDSRVLRGGSWLDHDYSVRSADRAGGNPSGTTSYLGFRCSRSP